MSILDVLNADNASFRVFVTWGGFLLIKMLFMSILTGIQRGRKGAVENPEDLGRQGVSIRQDEDVERVRRAHLNDLENIPAFLAASFIYIMTEPNFLVASWLIRVGVIARIGHTIVYAIYPIRQPARGICFMVTALITIFMIVWSMVYFFHF